MSLYIPADVAYSTIMPKYVPIKMTSGIQRVYQCINQCRHTLACKC